MIRRRLLLALAPCCLALVACGPSAARQEADKESIRSSLEAYLPHLAEAYATGDTATLKGLAAEKEIASVDKRIRDLASEGRSLRPTFHDLTVQDVTVWGYANAYATTSEVWDLQLFAVGTDRRISQEIGQHSVVKYQLKREDDHWLVLFRAIQG